MEKQIMVAELTRNCNENKDKLLELIKLYDLTVLGAKVQRQQFKDITNEVLAKHEFYASREIERTGVKIGERITDERMTFLLSDSDFDRLQSLEAPIQVERNLTDENGYYITNWDMSRLESMNELSDFIIANILPASMRPVFAKVRRNVVQEEKLIKITRSAFGC